MIILLKHNSGYITPHLIPLESHAESFSFHSLGGSAWFGPGLCLKLDTLPVLFFHSVPDSLLAPLLFLKYAKNISDSGFCTYWSLCLECFPLHPCPDSHRDSSLISTRAQINCHLFSEACCGHTMKNSTTLPSLFAKPLTLLSLWDLSTP